MLTTRFAQASSESIPINKGNYIDFITETFDITISNNDFLGDYSDQYIISLNASYQLNEEWRIFGSVDSDKFGDIGLGYSFMLFDSMYNEVSTSIGSNTDNTRVYTTGIFTAIHYASFTFYSNIDVQYIDNQLQDFERIDRYEQIYLNKLIGLSYEVTDKLDIISSYGHDKRHYGKFKTSGTNIQQRNIYIEDQYDSYINLGVKLNIWGVKPYISHRFDLENKANNYWDFSLSFDF